MSLARVIRSDVSRLAKFPKTGAGAARVPATISRTGIQIYGKLREYRPPEEVFAADSLASLGSVPVTIGHPPGDVSPENARTVTIGHVSDVPPDARVKVDGSTEEWVRATLVIADARTLAKLDAAEQGPEVSCGYSCELDFTPGVTPGGEPYDVVQRKIVFNHVAVLLDGERARAGAPAKIRLDSQGNPMKIIVIDGVELEFGSEKHFAHVAAAHQKALDALQGKFDALQAKHDAAVAATAAEKTRADAATSGIDAAVEARMALFASAARLLPADYETKGKTDSQVRADAVAHALGGADKIVGKSEAYIEARFDSLVEAKAPTAPAQYHSKPGVKADAVVNINDNDDAFRASLAQKVSK